MKTLSERIADQARQKKLSSPHGNRAVVLALRDDIECALNDGWSIHAIHITLRDEGRIDFSYQAFRRHVHRILLGRGVTAAQRKRLRPSSPSHG